MRRWWHCGATGMGFAFGYPPPFFFGRGPSRPWWSREQYRSFLEDYLRDLEAYRKDLEQEIEEVKKEIDGLGS